eukprot:CAMPEP_0117006424 /NCGR_PEP_ID=MMETSP0472-20121206/6657_1 /TAXON_ID=693140 ORGANISM="Tiarina fusus, Strain LIS" /NCGR_SAMPLE_ID=MMETSP0472 /ASSEMBLY_ACC=CAM_ASM_000603 /LENGTH=468 /DNA_ID=CAMNT_0004707885 /DNA_START=22 /DNA_END=1428 /DNA_ORIENTATION=-
MSAEKFDSSRTICCIGAGYVGACTFAVIASKCPTYKVIVCDIDERRISQWNSDNLPLFEPNLKETINEAKTKNQNLSFTTDVAGSIKQSDIIFVAVSTPTKTYGRGAGKAFDMTSWEAVSRTIAAESESDKIIVEKSTVPVRTAEKVAMILESAKVHDIKFEILSNPEFLAEGSAIKDLLFPDRVLVGGHNTESGSIAMKRVCDIYRHWVPEEKIVTTNMWTSELAKLASNAMLAQRISSINAISALCEETGADVEEVGSVLGMDDRIGSRYLKASVGFGGSCLKKDVLAMVYICETYELHTVAEFWKSVVTMNEFQKQRFATRILETMYGTVRGKKLCILGYAFKKDTGDVRESSAIEIVEYLRAENADLHIFDPRASESDIHSRFPDVVCHKNVEDAMAGAHALVVITEWDEFKEYDYEKVFEKMQKPAFIFDGRNILDHKKLEKIGFHVHAIGKRNQREFKHFAL